MSPALTHVGVLGGAHIPELKSQLLLFDQLLLPDLAGWRKLVKPEIRAALDWLNGEGVLQSFDYDEFRDRVLAPLHETNDGTLNDLITSFVVLLRSARTAEGGGLPRADEVDLNRALGPYAFRLLREIAADVERPEVRASPLMPEHMGWDSHLSATDLQVILKRGHALISRRAEIYARLSSVEEQRLFGLACRAFTDAADRSVRLDIATQLGALPAKADIVRVILPALPSIGDDVPIEDVLEFARDPDAAKLRARLHRWVRRVASEQLSANEVADELGDLCATYEEHIELATLAHRTSWVEVLLRVPADLMENLLRLRFGKAAESLFMLRRANLQLREADLAAPGREVAYIVQAHTHFSRGG